MTLRCVDCDGMVSKDTVDRCRRCHGLLMKRRHRVKRALRARLLSVSGKWAARAGRLVGAA